jgi:hypothetical protein
MLRCFLNERFLAVSAWFRVIGGFDSDGTTHCFDGVAAMGVASSIWLRLGCISIGEALRFLAMLNPFEPTAKASVGLWTCHLERAFLRSRIPYPARNYLIVFLFPSRPR